MAALIADRKTLTAATGLREFPVADNVTIWEGAMVAVDTSGYARPARANATDSIVGIAFLRADNTINGHVAGGIRVRVRDNDIAFFNNSASTDLIANVNVGAPCYAVDDQTLALTSGSGARSVAGNIYWVNESGQVGVKFTK